jgi:hypothetical protein
MQATRIRTSPRDADWQPPLYDQQREPRRWSTHGQCPAHEQPDRLYWRSRAVYRGPSKQTLAPGLSVPTPLRPSFKCQAVNMLFRSRWMVLAWRVEPLVGPRSLLASLPVDATCQISAIQGAADWTSKRSPLREKPGTSIQARMTYKFRATIWPIRLCPTLEKSCCREGSLLERIKGNPTAVLYQTVQLLSRPLPAEVFRNSTNGGYLGRKCHTFGLPSDE